MKTSKQNNINFSIPDSLKIKNFFLKSIVFWTSLSFPFVKPVFSMHKIVYFLMCIIACTIYSMQRLNLSVPSLINNYVNDFLCLPILLGVISFVIRRLKNDYSFRLPFLFVIILASYYSFYFEQYLPRFNSRYTADWIDVILYFLGGFAFLIAEKHFYKKNS